MGEIYLHLGTKALKEKHATQHSNRWSELCRLPYFDLCRMIVIDPMHNLILGRMHAGTMSCTRRLIKRLSGLSKNHFYHIWITQNILRLKHELNQLHTLLSKVSLALFDTNACSHQAHLGVSLQFQDTWPRSRLLLESQQGVRSRQINGC